MKMPEINKILEGWLSVPPDTITAIVIVACAAIFLLSFVSHKLRNIAPALMVSAGIIGTFWGTFIALSGFQIGTETRSDIALKAMVDSLPEVLGGMKSAFITSLIGLFAAFVSKIIFIIFLQKAPKPLPVEQDMKNLLSEIKNGIIGDNDKSLSSQLSTLQAEYRDGAKELKQAIAGDSESSIAMQLIKLRNENNEGLTKLDGRLDGLAEAIQDSLVKNMQSLMQQIEDVIVNQLSKQLEKTNDLLHTQLSAMLDRIEEALIKQFGETFKQFNEATQAIKKWQEEHKEHVEQLTLAFQETARGIADIRVNCESIPATMQEFTRLMGELDQRLQAFAEMKTQAVQFFPVIKENLDAIGDDLRQSGASIAGLGDTIKQTYEEAQNLANSHIETAKRHVENTGAQIDQAINKISEISQQMIEESGNVSTQHSAQMEKIISEVRETSQQCTAVTKESLTKMAEQHSQEINGLMKEIVTKWGSNVVGIAEKVAEVIRQGRHR